MTRSISRGLIFTALSLSVLATGAVSAQAETQPVRELGLESKWYVSPFIGQLNYEGDEEVKDGFLFGARLGYDYSEWWSIEGGLYIAPKLDENFRNSYGKRISRLEETAGEGVHDAAAFGVFIEGLFHFTRWERLDPYLSLGGGITYYTEELEYGQSDPALRVGGGVMYHFNDEWSVRVDGRTFVAGRDTEANAIIDAGVVWTWGARVPRKLVAVAGPDDTDGDGLADETERGIGTDPYNPDTDGDGLTDGEEVLTYGTDPKNPDSDWDALKDGPEVKTHGTNPLKRDTDDGGVADGHEVIEDRTDPLDGRDDLIMFELNINFDYDKAVIKPRYFDELDIIAKVLKRHEKATARIEGHADKTRKSDAEYNRKLSQRRAESVLKYLSDVGGIDASRLTAVGYGFSRPKAPNDPAKGNPANRRVEVYIRKDGTPTGKAGAGSEKK